MSKKTIVCFLVFVLVAFLSGCSAVQPADDGEVVLEIVGLNETISLTMADLQAMTPTEGWGGTISSAGVITPPQRLKGVLLESLVDLVGGLQPSMGVNIVAKDGYGMTMAYDQIMEGDFITYDPGTGSENQVEGPLRVIVAYERDGEPLSAEEDGPLRLFIISPENDNIVDGHWAIKWTNQIRIKPMSEEWSLYLEGALTEDMDRNSFESCSAPGCHQATWTDESGNEWSGVPLYYLAGRVDDGVIHEGRAYNDEFAQAGYIVQLFAADGYNIGIESSRTDFNRHIFVAATVNGEMLDEKHFPLRLVGDELDSSEMIGQIAQIVIQPNEGVAMPSGETPAGESAEGPVELVLPEGAALMVFGQVMNKFTLGLENLQVMNVVELEIEHPKKGLQTYQGIRLNDLLNLAGADPAAAVLVITASDSYAAEVNLDDVLNCADCLISLEEDGTLNMVMAGMESNFWIKDVNFLEVK